VLFYEDLSSNPQGYLDTVCDFVGARRIDLDRSKVGGAKVYSAPGAARSNPIARSTVEALDWISRHGARPLIQLGQRTALWKVMRRPFVEDFPPLSPESADEIRAMMLPETEELEQLTGRDLSRWKDAAHRERDDNGAVVRSVAG
jgi:hypothetical protein